MQLSQLGECAKGGADCMGSRPLSPPCVGGGAGGV